MIVKLFCKTLKEVRLKLLKVQQFKLQNFKAELTNKKNFPLVVYKSMLKQYKI